MIFQVYCFCLLKGKRGLSCRIALRVNFRDYFVDFRDFLMNFQENFVSLHCSHEVGGMD